MVRVNQCNVIIILYHYKNIHDINPLEREKLGKSLRIPFEPHICEMLRLIQYIYFSVFFFRAVYVKPYFVIHTVLLTDIAARRVINENTL